MYVSRQSPSASVLTGFVHIFVRISKHFTMLGKYYMQDAYYVLSRGCIQMSLSFVHFKNFTMLDLLSSPAYFCLRVPAGK